MSSDCIPIESRRSPRRLKCSICQKSGHNRRTCPENKRDERTTELAENPYVWAVATKRRYINKELIDIYDVYMDRRAYEKSRADEKFKILNNPIFNIIDTQRPKTEKQSIKYGSVVYGHGNDHVTDRYSGTIGCFVRSDNDYYAVTCRHVTKEINPTKAIGICPLERNTSDEDRLLYVVESRDTCKILNFPEEELDISLIKISSPNLERIDCRIHNDLNCIIFPSRSDEVSKSTLLMDFEITELADLDAYMNTTYGTPLTILKYGGASLLTVGTYDGYEEKRMKDSTLCKIRVKWFTNTSYSTNREFLEDEGTTITRTTHTHTISHNTFCKKGDSGSMYYMIHPISREFIPIAIHISSDYYGDLESNIPIGISISDIGIAYTEYIRQETRNEKYLEFCS